MLRRQAVKQYIDFLAEYSKQLSQYIDIRNTYNLTNTVLSPNDSGAEYTASASVLDLLSNGFKLRGAASGLNVSSATYIFAAFAENPFKNSNAR